MVVPLFQHTPGRIKWLALVKGDESGRSCHTRPARGRYAKGDVLKRRTLVDYQSSALATDLPGRGWRKADRVQVEDWVVPRG